MVWITLLHASPLTPDHSHGPPKPRLLSFPLHIMQMTFHNANGSCPHDRKVVEELPEAGPWSQGCAALSSSLEILGLGAVGSWLMLMLVP